MKANWLTLPGYIVVAIATAPVDGWKFWAAMAALIWVEIAARSMGRLEEKQ